MHAPKNYTAAAVTLAVTLVLLGTEAMAQPTVYEPWNYSNLSLSQGDDVLGAVGTDSFGFDAGSASWAFGQGSGTAVYDVAGLNYIGSNFNILDTTGGAVTITPAVGDTKFVRTLETPIIRPGGGEPAQNYWVSFLLRFDASDTGTPGDAFWTPDSWWDKGAVGFQQNSEIRFVNGPTSGVAVEMGETHLVVTNLVMPEIDTGGMDEAYLYVDPILGAIPIEANATYTSEASSSNNGRIRDAANAYFKFNEVGNAIYTIDEFRIGDTFASVTPFAPGNFQTLALYTLPSAGDGVTERSSNDTEPLTMAGTVTGGVDALGTEGGISLPTDIYNEFTADEAFAAGDYLEFNIELDQATSMSMQNLSFDIDLEGFASVASYALRSSADSYAADIESGDFALEPRPLSTTETINIGSVAGLQDVTSDVTFRLAFYGALGDGALLGSIDIFGSVEGDTGTPGDFDDDGDVDGNDFLLWQRGESPDGGTSDELTDWNTHFGSTEPKAANAIAVPEPTSLVLVGLGGLLLLLHRRA